MSDPYGFKAYGGLVRALTEFQLGPYYPGNSATPKKVTKCGECGAALEGASYDHDPTCSQFPVDRDIINTIVENTEKKSRNSNGAK
jgi:hypothetical protein